MNLNKMSALSVGVIALMLSACGDKPANTPAAGAGTSANVSADTSNSESLSRDRQVSIDNTASSKVSMPAWALLVEAANEMNDELPIPEVDNSRLVDIITGGDKKEEIAFESVDCPYGLGKNLNQTVRIEIDGNKVKEFAKKGKIEDYFSDIFSPLNKEGDLTACGKARDLVLRISKTSKPIMGWPGRDRDYYAVWATQKSEDAEIVNLVASEVIKAVKANSLRDPEDAKGRLKNALVDFVKSGGYDSVKNSVVNPCLTNIRFNFSGHGKHVVEFSCGSTLYGGDANGWSVVKNGVDWFGNGVIMGKKIDLALDSAISTGMSKRSGISSDQGTGAAVDARGEAGIK